MTFAKARQSRLTLGIVVGLLASGGSAVATWTSLYGRAYANAVANVRTIATEVVEQSIQPLREDYRAHKSESEALRPVMLDWKTDETRKLQIIADNQMQMCIALRIRCRAP